MTVLRPDEVEAAGNIAGAPAPQALSMPPAIKRRRFEFLYFALRNKKLLIGLSLVLVMVLIALIGPLFVKHSMLTYGPPFRPPSSSYWFGTNYFGVDVFSQFVYGLREEPVRRRARRVRGDGDRHDPRIHRRLQGRSN